MLTAVFRLEQPQPHNVEALPEESGVGLAGSGGGDQLHHGLQEQLLVLCAGQNLPEGQAKGPPHGPDQCSKQGL